MALDPLAYANDTQYEVHRYLSSLPSGFGQTVRGIGNRTALSDHQVARALTWLRKQGLATFERTKGTALWKLVGR